jgi:transposase
MNQVSQHVLGIDVSKATFDVALLHHRQIHHKQFPNQARGFRALQAWLAKHTVAPIHVCMEATGKYGEALAEFLHAHAIRVSVVNPLRIKAFARSELSRTKTDKQDAAVIARFCVAMRPGSWQPAPPEIQQLKAYTRRLDALTALAQQEHNRLEGEKGFVEDDIRQHVEELQIRIHRLQKVIAEHLKQHPTLCQQQALLLSIPGIGERTVAQILSICGSIHQFSHAKQLAAFCGLSPRTHQSGSSVKGRGRLSKMGHASLRKALFFPALVAMKFNPQLKAMRERLLAAGKPKMVVVGAVMRKLLHQIYGVLKSGVPFRPERATGAS